MPVIKVGGGLSGGNSGSSADAVGYLEKENKTRKKSERSTEGFFNQDSYDIDRNFVVKKLDSKRQGIKKHEGKFYNLIISPSQKELAELTDDDLKDYTKDLMIKYAENFDRGVDPNDVVWFAKLEKRRKYKGFKQKKNKKLNLPPGVKSGDYKTGDNRHIHVLVRRKTEQNKSLSPLANQRKGTTKGAAVGKVGFNRIKFSAAAENVMRKHIERVNPDYRFKFDDLQAHQFLKNNNNDYEKARKLGFYPAALDALLNREEKRKADQAKQIRKDVVLELRDAFSQAMDEKPKNLREYQSILKGLGIKVKPIENEDGNLTDYQFLHQGLKIKPSEIEERAVQQNLVVILKGNKKAENKKINKEVVKDAFNQVITKKPENLREYQVLFEDSGIEVEPIKNEKGKLIDYAFYYNGQIFKPDEIDNKAILYDLEKTVEKNRKAKQPLTSAEKTKIAVDFHRNENYRGKLRNPSVSYIDNAFVNAVESKYGFKITKEELQKAFREIKLNNPRKGLSP